MTALFYFSGTGNSLYLAKCISEKTSARLHPIAGFLNTNSINVQDDVIGIVFPVYYGDIPVVVKEFVKKLEGLEGKYIFAVCNYGGAMGCATKNLRKLIRGQGGRLNLVYSVHMTQNAFYKASEKRDKLFRHADQLIIDINDRIDRKSTGTLSTNRMLDVLLASVYAFFIPLTRKYLQKITDNPSTKSIDELIRISGKTFSANEKCSRCGTCTRVCPVGNIRIDENTPIWDEHCENCLACYNWCPKKAIVGQLVEREYFYLHPDIKFEEVIRQNNSVSV